MSARYTECPDCGMQLGRPNAHHACNNSKRIAELEAALAEARRRTASIHSLQEEGYYQELSGRLADQLRAALNARDTALERIASLERQLAEARASGERLLTAREYEDWHEDMGAVLWHVFPIQSPPYCGTPLDDTFPHDHNDEPMYTHWTPLPDCNEIQRRFDVARRER